MVRHDGESTVKSLPGAALGVSLDRPGPAALLCHPGPTPPTAGPLLAALPPCSSASPARSLWSHLDADRARQSLRQALTQLRRVVGVDALETDGDRVRLRAAIDSDVARFERALSAGDPAGALAFVGGPILDGFATPGGAAFE